MSIPKQTTESKPNGGWFRLENRSLERIREIGTTAYCVLAVLARHADERGECWPSEELIAAYIGTSERTVRRCIRTLEQAGLIASTRRRRDSILYRLDRTPMSDQGKQDRTPVSDQEILDRTNLANRPDTSVQQTGHQCPPNKTQEQDSTNKTKKRDAANAAAPAGLLAFVDCWNTNCPEGKRTRRDPPTAAVAAGWRRTSKNPELRQAFNDLERLGAAIRKAQWARGQPWFTVESLFERDSQRLNWKIIKLLNGEYDGGNDHANSKRAPLQTRGLRYDPAAPIADHL